MVSTIAPAVSVAPPSSTATTIKWLAPAPLWDTPGTALQQPFVAEFTEDSFMPDFLAMMAGNVKLDLPAPQSHIGNQTDILYKLFQPIHKRYYLITASLICRQLGMPDRTVDRKNGEKVSFVLRRLVPLPRVSGQKQHYTEQAWVEAGQNKGWQLLVDDQKNPVLLRKDEERLPLQQVKYCPFIERPASPAGSVTRPQPKPCSSRVVYHGYIPVDQREKYLVPATDAAQKIQNLIDHPKPTDPVVADPRLDEVTTRVIESWRALYIYLDYSGNQATEHLFTPLTSPPNTAASPTTAPTLDIQQQISLNVIVDLKDFLKNNLNSIYTAIVNSTALPASSTKQQTLLSELQNITLDTNDPSNPKMSLTDAIKKLDNSMNLAKAENGPHPDTYNLLNATSSVGPVSTSNASYLAPPPLASITNPQPEGTLHILFRDALNEEKIFHPNGWLSVPDEIGKMIKNDPVGGDLYWLRLVYEHDPCYPVMSDHSAPFSFAKVFDPDAPARPIRIELPSIKLKDLRKYKRGVGMQMSPALGDVINKVNPGMLQGGGLLNTGSTLGIAMICSFSIPIITLCALIVMFIFLILLNIIFWWLPFIRICFPVPD